MTRPSSEFIPDHIDVEDLRNNYDTKEKDLVRHQFDEQQLVEMKDEYFQLSSKLDARLELAKTVKALAETDPEPLEAIAALVEETVDVQEYGEMPAKALKVQTTALLKKINVGHENIEEQLYGMAFHEAGRMAYYDGHGMFVYDRPLRPEERQTSIRSMKAS
jgi:hypothetical protein